MPCSSTPLLPDEFEKEPEDEKTKQTKQLGFLNGYDDIQPSDDETTDVKKSTSAIRGKQSERNLRIVNDKLTPQLEESENDNDHDHDHDDDDDDDDEHAPMLLHRVSLLPVAFADDKKLEVDRELQENGSHDNDDADRDVYTQRLKRYHLRKQFVDRIIPWRYRNGHLQVDIIKAVDLDAKDRNG
ncbi:hypothetical protein RFI_13761 [Reticulomyxa filosa]|uniref:Uncharacterized protein n=1 Tax=Reticulomyxa filosa TaxID=46433 RepID=X6NBR1_RETFI|nr:hypothetical protein RFI_13761 [Reticulomyxa filosa]|eukprot:ETO23421.1 hypothetical protein RFI_13761 [Reticulomyxa filosa]